MANSNMKWYVLRAISGKEAKVKEYIDAEIGHNDRLAAHVAQVLLPTEKTASLHNGKRVVKEKLSLPGLCSCSGRLKRRHCFCSPFHA